MHVTFTLEAVVTFLLEFLVLNINLLGLGKRETVLSNPKVTQCRLEYGIAC